MNAQTLATLDLLDHAVWITNPESGSIVWANRSAVALWNADDLAELLARPINPSPTIQATLLQLRDRVASGERVRQERTIFPKGEAKRIEMVLGRFDLDGGRVGLLVEARPVRQMDPEMVRDAMMIQANTLARQTFGNTFTLHSIFLHGQDVSDLLNQTEKGETFSRDVQVFTLEGKRWFAVEARKVLDPVTGAAAILVSAHDMTARIEAEQAKEDLVSIVSHELRTPMTGIKGAIELLAGGMADGDPDLFRELLQMAAENTRRLGALVDDLLDVRKITSGHLSVDFKPCDLKHALVATVGLNQAAAQSRQIKIDCRVNTPLPVYADEGRIQQVILNLISNALKHTPAGGTIAVVGEVLESHVRIAVIDGGSGVPEEFRDRIFQRFAQADSSSTRSKSGTGLGLYIAKTLVEVHGGRLGFENTENAGATFFFELPLLTPTSDKPAISTRFRR
jgi:signal transduction histidine kinase